MSRKLTLDDMRRELADVEGRLETLARSAPMRTSNVINSQIKRVRDVRENLTQTWQHAENQTIAAEKISRIYFEIAAEVVGEDKAKEMFDERFNKAISTLKESSDGR